MFNKSTNAGALALLAAPVVVIAAVLIQPTLSGDASTQVTALTRYHQAMITGMALRFIALVLLIAGTLWLALALGPRAPRLAIAGAVLGVVGALVVLFENSVAAAAPAMLRLVACEQQWIRAVIQPSHRAKFRSEGVDMFRRAVLALTAVFSLVAAGGLATAGAAAAATGGPGDTVTTTQNFHGVVTFPSVNPCTGNPSVVTATSNVVTHETFFPATGEDHVTFTNEFSFTVVEATATATGHFTTHSNVNMNQQNSNSTFTSSEHATSSDGSTVTAHEVAHFTLNPDGTLTVSFDRPSLTCG